MEYVTLTAILFLMASHIARAEKNKCLAIVNPRFHNCGNVSNPSFSQRQCANVRLCSKKFNFTTIDLDPFVVILNNVLFNALNMCCGSCGTTWHNYTKVLGANSLSHSLINTTNFIFPVLGIYGEENIHGFHYISLIELSNGYYVTRIQTPDKAMGRLIASCANLWPLLVIILLLALIAGFVIWLAETWINEEEFPRDFLIGLFDGFWWSFVSMTTVGYGDKSPKFVVSRLFSVLWILIGITICSMFTASLTTEINSAVNPDEPDMHGKTVGILKYRAFDASLVAKHGGLVREADDTKDLAQMLSDIDSGVDGVFMDKYTYMHSIHYAMDAVRNPNHLHGSSREVSAYFLKKTMKSKKMYDGERMSYGVLVKEREDFEFLNEFIKHNQGVYETCAVLELNEMESGAKSDVMEKVNGHDLFSIEGGHFYPFLYGALFVLSGIFLFGIIFEARRKKLRIRKETKV